MTTPTLTNPASPRPSPASPPPSPESRIPIPPSERDFQIYDAIHISGCSTRSQADLHDISHTRVRQIVRRVAEWLGQVLPPQTKVAKEQETHLARQIAADRFQRQFEQATRCWDMTQESKYAGLRMRLTTAQARLGVVGGILDGLAADAIEGLPVPAWTSPAEPDQAALDQAVPRLAVGRAANHGEDSFNPVGLAAPTTPEVNDNQLPASAAATSVKPPMSYKKAVHYYKLQHILADTDPPSLANKVAEARRVLRAAGAILMDEQPAAETTSTPPAPLTMAEPSSAEIPNPQPAIPNSFPPSEDCSPTTKSIAVEDATAPLLQTTTPTTPSTCEPTTTPATADRQPQKLPSHPLLTSAHAHPLPITQLQVIPSQPGLAVTTNNDLHPSPTHHSRTHHSLMPAASDE